MANWTVAQKKAAARIFSQALPSLHVQKSSIKPTLTVIKPFREPPRASPVHSVSSTASEYDLEISDSDVCCKESGTTTDEVLFVL